MKNKPNLLLWAQSPAPYVEAIKEAGLADRVVVHTLAPSEKPSAEQLQQAEVLMTYNIPPGVLVSVTSKLMKCNARPPPANGRTFGFCVWK